jgi:hypothetical protein
MAKKQAPQSEAKVIDGITVNYYSKGKDHWVNASCPYCHVVSDNIDIYGGDMGFAAINKIKGHIRTAHPEKSN